jgi:hypothetical protein
LTNRDFTGADAADPPATGRGGALLLLRLGLSNCTVLLGLVVTAWLAWRVFFSSDFFFDELAISVGLIGVLAACLRGRLSVTPLHLPVAVYGALTLASAFVNHGHYRALLGADPLPDWQSTVHAGALVLYFFGACELFTTPRRIGIALVAMVVCACAIGVISSYDRIVFGWGQRVLEYVTLPRWGGYAELGLLFVVTLPIPAALMIVSPTLPGIVPALIVAGTLSLAMALVDSRSAYATAAVVYAAFMALEYMTVKRYRLALLAALAIAIVAAFLAWRPSDQGRFKQVVDYRTRVIQLTTAARVTVWKQTVGLIRDHPWIGVGPGNYQDAIQKKWVPRVGYLFYSNHAHNMMLHVAAESGIPALGAFLLIWWFALKRLLALTTPSYGGVLAFGLFGALVAFFVRSLSDHFLSGLYVSDRLGILMWTLLALASTAIWSLPSGRLRETP